INGFATI
ncbi:hypothetical protein VC116063_003254B, partial [Vibrio cholerae O1 str. 116063]